MSVLLYVGIINILCMYHIKYYVMFSYMHCVCDISNVYFCKIMFTPKDLTRTNMLHTLRYVTYFTLCNI